MAGGTARHSHIPTAEPGMSMGAKIGIGLAAIILGGAGYYFLDRASEDNKLNTLFNSAEARKINTINGQRGDITLSDGSKLNIGPATKLTIIPNYNEMYRGVMVDGTASFDVKPSPNTPLEVRTAGAALVVDEGSFIVSGYKDEGEGFIKLTSGSASIRAKDFRREVTAPAALYIGKDSSITDADPERIGIATAWSEGNVILKGMTLSEVLPKFNRYFGIKIALADPALGSRPVDMTAQLDSKQKAIDALAASAFVKFGYDDQNPVFRDDPAAAAKAAKAAKK
ncbi:MAG: DUF4974 domain-containing protein [Gemmatimonadetes bacterium]|nr:DUF4974 domain-containing protein [Gemmatimonadota bacterium]